MELTLHDSMKYDHGINDQFDWNKLFGLKVNYFKPHKDSMMWAWRYNPNKDELEFMPYQHRTGKVVKHNDLIFTTKFRENKKNKILHRVKRVLLACSKTRANRPGIV